MSTPWLMVRNGTSFLLLPPPPPTTGASDRQISLFLQYRVQLPDGTLVLDAKGKLPIGVDTPGIIRYLGSGGEREGGRGRGRVGIGERI